MWTIEDFFLQDNEDDETPKKPRPRRLLISAKVGPSKRGGFSWNVKWSFPDGDGGKLKPQIMGARFSKLVHAQYDLFKYLVNGRSPKHSKQALDLATGEFAVWKPATLAALIEEKKRVAVAFADESVEGI